MVLIKPQALFFTFLYWYLQHISAIILFNANSEKSMTLIYRR